MEINVFHWSEEYAAFPSVEYSHGMHVREVVFHGQTLHMNLFYYTSRF